MRWTKPRLTLLQERLAAAYPEARCALDHGDPFQLVVATILSAQCTDARVNLTTPALFARYPNAAALASAEPAELETLIHATGFFRNKARNLIGLGQALIARHGGQVPSDPQALGALPGVGQKTANVVLANAFGVPALAVDTHIFRVARRLGLSEATTPEKVEADLCRLFPRDTWIELHHQLIWHGRRTCDARKPACANCSVAELCPTGKGTIADPHTGQPVLAAAPGKQGPPALPAHSGGPQRIISLVPSVTELLAQWGLVRRMAGRTRYCVEPTWIRNAVPALGGTKDPDISGILAQRPDLVLLEKDENTRDAAEALQAAGIPIHVLNIRSAADARRALLELGDLIGVPDQAKAAAAALDLKPRRGKARRTLILVWREPWIAAGPDTYVADLARIAGFEPLGPNGYPRLSDADLTALQPEVILLPTDPFHFTAKHRKELEHYFPQATVSIVEGKALTWMLSRTGEGLALLRELRKDLAV
ncbi:MAG: endonuclease III [Holophaga sp.]